MGGESERSGLAVYYRHEAEATFGDDEPHYRDICAGIAESPELLDLLAAHPDEARQPNLLLAAAHYLLLRGLNHPLGLVYTGASAAEPFPLFRELVLDNRDKVDELLSTRRTQTNEVGRCAALAPAFRNLYRTVDRPFAWIDLGTSAGLNLLLDRLRIDYYFDERVATTGPSDAPVAIECSMVGEDPGIDPAVVPIEWRVGIDRRPVEVLDDEQTTWLRATVWPSAVARAARLDAALTLAKGSPPAVIAAEAAAGVLEALAAAPDDAHLVVTTSWVWYYFGEQTRTDVLAVLAAAGRPVSWISVEGVGVVEQLGPGPGPSAASVLGEVTFDGGDVDSARRLALTHPHGTWLDWGVPPR